MPSEESQTFNFLFPTPPFQNLCFYWQVFSPDQRTINMTPQNAHILTPKINCVPLDWSRHMAPTRTVPSVYISMRQAEFSIHNLHCKNEMLRKLKI